MHDQDQNKHCEDAAIDDATSVVSVLSVRVSLQSVARSQRVHVCVHTFEFKSDDAAGAQKGLHNVLQ